jgi:hypothetical protein
MKNNTKKSCNIVHTKSLCDLGHMAEVEDQVNTFLYYYL